MEREKTERDNRMDYCKNCLRPRVEHDWLTTGCRLFFESASTPEAAGHPWEHLPHATVTVDKETGDKLRAIAKSRRNGYTGPDATPECRSCGSLYQVEDDLCASCKATERGVAPEAAGALDEIDALVREVAPPPLCVSDTALRQLTERIMSFFWASDKPPVKLETEQYNRLYSHVLKVLSDEAGEDSPNPEQTPRMNREQRRHARFVEKKPGW